MNALAENSAPTNDRQTAVSFQRARRNKSLDLNEFCTTHCSSTSAEKTTTCDAATASQLTKAFADGAGSSLLKSCAYDQKNAGLSGYPKSTGKVQYM